MVFSNIFNMSEFECKLCSEEYTHDEHVPKMIPCGHSFCLLCFLDLIQFLESCPVCYTQVSGNFRDLPTNYALLEGPSKPTEDTDSKKTKLLTQVAEQKIRVSKLQDVASKLNQIVDSSQNKVKSFREANAYDDDEDKYESEMNFKSMEERLWKLDLALYCCYNPRIKADFILGSYSTKEKFVQNISTELYKKKSIFAFKSEWYNNEVRWGRLNFKGGKLLIHSFHSNAPSYPSLFVPFRDLQKCMCLENFGTFMCIEEEFLTCKVTTSSPKTLDFVQLCSGEDGPTFKGLIAEKINQPGESETIKIEISKPKVVENDYEFLFTLPSDIKETTDEKVQIKMCEGRCEIVKNPIRFPNPEKGQFEVGVATETSEVFSSYINERVVRDSGIFILVGRSGRN